MKKIITIIYIIIIIFSLTLPAFAEDLEINAPCYILVDPKTEQVLYEENSNLKWYPASTTKIMTAILVIENGNLDKIVTANQSNIDPGNGGANIGIMDGEELSIRTLLNALLVKSANETANILADNICPTRQEFIDLMNKKALELGCTNTHFVTTNGMHDDNHYTTVSDMAKIACYAMTLKEFREIVAQPNYTMPETNKHNRISENYWGKIYNTNQLFYYTSTFYNEILGIKTGYTKEAKNNLVSSVKAANGMELLAVVFGDVSINKRNVFTSSRSLFEYGFKNFSSQKILSGNEIIQSVGIKDAVDNSKLALVTEKDLYSILPNNSSNWNLEKNVKIYTSQLQAPIEKGNTLGSIEYRRNGTLLGKINIVAATSIKKSVKALVKEKAIKLVDTKIFKYLCIALVIILFFILLRFTLRKISRIANSKVS